jgi:hypothetical protein
VGAVNVSASNGNGAPAFYTGVKRRVLMTRSKAHHLSKPRGKEVVSNAMQDPSAAVAGYEALPARHRNARLVGPRASELTALVPFTTPRGVKP